MELFLSALLLFLMIAMLFAAPQQIDLEDVCKFTKLNAYHKFNNKILDFIFQTKKNAATMESDRELPLAKVDPEIDYPALDISEVN